MILSIKHPLQFFEILQKNWMFEKRYPRKHFEFDVDKEYINCYNHKARWMNVLSPFII
jgi:hypothetical protein